MNDIKFNKNIATIYALVEQYKKSGRFTEEMAQSIIKTIEGKDLKIAVIGKMKAGKSTFTNALIFHENVLPSGQAPTTVTLTNIEYTDDPSKDSVTEVELLTSSDIEDIKANTNSTNPKIAEKARELLSSLNKIPGGYEQYVSKGKVVINLDELDKFTSKDGELSGLAKKVTIYKHIDVLKGITITDTPGFNDPVTSRGDATRNALKDCHIILFIHDYLDKYDQDEIAILLEQVEYSGVSMLVDIINKMDMNGDLQLSQWPTYLLKFDRKKEEAIKQIPKEGIKELLAKGTTSYVSALMALVGYEVLNCKKNNCEPSDDTKNFFVDCQSDFPELKQADDFIKYSNIAGIVNIINQLSADKSKYLENYPIQTLAGLLKSLVDTISAEIKSKESELGVLAQSAADAKQQLDAINEIFEPLSAKISSPNLAISLRDCISDTRHQIQNWRDNKCVAEFTSSNYEKPGTWSNGPEKRNLARYKGVLFDFDNEVRNDLEKLKSSFDTKCEYYVNDLVSGLVTNNINLQSRESLKNSLISLLKSEISTGLFFVVNPNEPDDYLSGADEQYSLYRSDFLQRRSDSVIDEKYLKMFRGFVDDTISSNKLRESILDEIEKLKRKLKESINYSPADKKNEIKRLEQEIEKLTKEREGVETDIESLDKLTKEA